MKRLTWFQDLLNRFGSDALFRKNKNGDNLLYVAALTGSAKFVRRFLESGLDPKEKNQTGVSALDIIYRDQNLTQVYQQFVGSA